jgi:hypothetical protein
MRNSVRTLQQVLEKPFRGGPVASRLYQDVNDLTVLIDGSPQVMSRSFYADEHLVDMPASAYSPSAVSQSSGVLGPKFAAP